MLPKKLIAKNYKKLIECPYCRENLLNQDYFNERKFLHKCVNCGKTSYNPLIYSGEKYKDIYWHCDKCNSLLNSQKNFNDRCGKWECTRCGFINKIEESKIK